MDKMHFEKVGSFKYSAGSCGSPLCFLGAAKDMNKQIFFSCSKFPFFSFSSSAEQISDQER